MQVLYQPLLHLPGLGGVVRRAGQENTVVAVAEILHSDALFQVQRAAVAGEVLLLVGQFQGGFGGGGILAFHMGGNGVFGAHAFVEEVLQDIAVGLPVRVIHGAVIHAGAHAVGPIHRQGHLVRFHPQETGQLHQQRGDLALGEVGLHQRQNRVEQFIQFGHRGMLDLVQHRLDNRTLAHNALPVVVDGTQACILQGGVTVQMVEPRVDLAHNEHGVGGDFPVEGGGFGFGQFNVDAAHRVHDLDKGVEVDAHITVQVQVQTLGDRVHGQTGTAVAEGMGDPVIFVLIAFQQNGHTGGTLDGYQLDGIFLNVQRYQDQAVGPGILAEFGGSPGAVQFIQMGEGISIIDGFGSFVGADEQDVQHVVVLEGTAFRHDHLAVVMFQAGAVQVLVLVGTDGPHGIHRAVIVMDQIQLAVDVRHRQTGHDHHHAQDPQQNPRPQRQAALLAGLGRGFGGLFPFGSGFFGGRLFLRSGGLCRSGGLFRFCGGRFLFLGFVRCR